MDESFMQFSPWNLNRLGSTKSGSVRECREAIEELYEFLLTHNIGDPRAMNSILDTFTEAGFLDQVSVTSSSSDRSHVRCIQHRNWEERRLHEMLSLLFTVLISSTSTEGRIHTREWIREIHPFKSCSMTLMPWEMISDRREKEKSPCFTAWTTETN